MAKYYAGVGARLTPQPILDMMSEVSKYLESEGYILRSGGAKGADTAFAKNIHPDNKEIYEAKDYTFDAVVHARMHHPNWQSVSAYGRLLHARNSIVVLGKDLSTPVDFVLCWTNKGQETQGGTSQTIRVARANNIPVINFGSMTPTEVETTLSNLVE